jgi:methylenetetrahydrofolate reductase (NADPH)
MSVTYGAGGGTSAYTLDIGKNIKDNYGVPLLAHLTCISSSKDAVKAQIDAIKAAGIKNVMALRGDIPEDMKDEDRSNWDYNHAYELIEQLKNDDYDFCIGGACYPEVHPESENQSEDIKSLKTKVDAGVDFLTTQMVFDNNLFFNFMYKLREAGVTVPVVPGIMPITNANQVERAIKLSGAFMPQRFKAMVDKFGSDPVAMRQAGIAYATDQIIDLYANGITNVHVYSMNKPDVAKGIYDNLTDILGKRF